MTWDSQDSATPQDPRAPEAQPQPGQEPGPEQLGQEQPAPEQPAQPPAPEPSAQPQYPQQPPPAYPSAGQGQPIDPQQAQQPPAGYPPQGQVPAPGQQPPPPYAPPPGDQWAGQPQQPPPPGYAPPPGDQWAGQPQQPPPPGYAPPPGDQWAGQPQQPPPPPPPPQGGRVPEAMWQPPPAYPLAPDAYPVNVSYDRDTRINRLWGIPLIGQLVRWILLIPHFIVMFLVAIVAAFILLVAWISVLLLGRFPGGGYRWVGGLLGYWQRVTAYSLLMTSTYPPFSLSGEMYPITVRYDEGVRIFRLWGIPIIGHLVRALVLIPHFIVLWFLAILVWILQLVIWVPVLILGRQADVIYTVVGGYNRWQLRTIAYLFMMVDRYPPFSLGEDDPRL